MGSFYNDFCAPFPLVKTGLKLVPLLVLLSDLMILNTTETHVTNLNPEYGGSNTANIHTHTNTHTRARDYILPTLNILLFYIKPLNHVVSVVHTSK